MLAKFYHQYSAAQDYTKQRIKNLKTALTGWLSWLYRCPPHLMVAGSILD